MADLISQLAGGGFRTERLIGFGRIGKTVKTGQARIYRGALVGADNTYAGAKHLLDAATTRFFGVAINDADPGSEVDIETVGVFGPYTYGPGGATDGIIGDRVYASTDDNTVTTAAAATNDVPVGTVFEVLSATKVFIKIGFINTGL